MRAQPGTRSLAKFNSEHNVGRNREENSITESSKMLNEK